MLTRSLIVIGHLALAALVAWALTIVTTNVARSLGGGPVLMLLLAFVIGWIVLKKSKR